MPLGFEQYYTPGTFEYDQGPTEFTYEGMDTEDWGTQDWINWVAGMSTNWSHPGIPQFDITGDTMAKCSWYANYKLAG